MVDCSIEIPADTKEEVEAVAQYLLYTQVQLRFYNLGNGIDSSTIRLKLIKKYSSTEIQPEFNYYSISAGPNIFNVPVSWNYTDSSYAELILTADSDPNFCQHAIVSARCFPQAPPVNSPNSSEGGFFAIPSGCPVPTGTFGGNGLNGIPDIQGGGSDLSSLSGNIFIVGDPLLTGAPANPSRSSPTDQKSMIIITPNSDAAVQNSSTSTAQGNSNDGGSGGGSGCSLDATADDSSFPGVQLLVLVMIFVLAMGSLKGAITKRRF